MATISSPRGPQTVRPTTKTGEHFVTVTEQQSKELIERKFELGITLALAFWPALTVAVQNQWGGPESSDKRDWLAGYLSDLLASRPETDIEDVEAVLLEFMAEEFDCQLEDDSEAEVAARVMGLRKMTTEGDFSEVDRLYRRWLERNQKGEMKVNVQSVDNANDMEEDSTDEEDEGGVDIDMDEAPQLILAKEKAEPKVDEDGFTKVTSKKKR